MPDRGRPRQAGKAGRGWDVKPLSPAIVKAVRAYAAQLRKYNAAGVVYSAPLDKSLRDLERALLAEAAPAPKARKR